jgi:hypothetical protein
MSGEPPSRMIRRSLLVWSHVPTITLKRKTARKLSTSAVAALQLAESGYQLSGRCEGLSLLPQNLRNLV